MLSNVLIPQRLISVSLNYIIACTISFTLLLYASIEPRFSIINEKSCTFAFSLSMSDSVLSDPT